MRVSVNPVRHTILGKKFTEQLPVVQCKLGSTIEGHIELKIGTLIDVSITDVGVYKVNAPTGTEKRYIRDPVTNYYDSFPESLMYTIEEKRFGRLVLFWRFLPSAISGVLLNDYYSIEFNIEDTTNMGTANTANVKGEVVVKVSADITG